MEDKIVYYVLGFLTFVVITLRSRNKYLKKKYNKLKTEQTEISKENYDKMKQDLEDSKKLLSDSKKELSLEKKKVEKLSKYLGLVDEHQYGILSRNLVRTVEENGIDVEKDCPVECEFVVVKRGQDNVKINITDVNIKSGNKTPNFIARVKELLDGWYDINSDDIKWIKPDKAIIRDIQLDKLLLED